MTAPDRCPTCGENKSYGWPQGPCKDEFHDRPAPEVAQFVVDAKPDLDGLTCSACGARMVLKCSECGLGTGPQPRAPLTTQGEGNETANNERTCKSAEDQARNNRGDPALPAGPSLANRSADSSVTRAPLTAEQFCTGDWLVYRWPKDSAVFKFAEAYAAHATAALRAERDQFQKQLTNVWSDYQRTAENVQAKFTERRKELRAVEERAEQAEQNASPRCEAHQGEKFNECPCCEAVEVDNLRQERDRLREALDQIAIVTHDVEVLRIARAALAQSAEPNLARK